jgi:hypothetical protein
LGGLTRAEENQAKVGQLLDYIEGQQNDLEGLLEGYERQVDELREAAIGGGGSVSDYLGVKKGLKGGELERERM